MLIGGCIGEPTESKIYLTEEEYIYIIASCGGFSRFLNSFMVKFLPLEVY